MKLFVLPTVHFRNDRSPVSEAASVFGAMVIEVTLYLECHMDGSQKSDLAAAAPTQAREHPLGCAPALPGDVSLLPLLYLATVAAALNAAGTAGSAKLIALPASLCASATVGTYLANFAISDVTNELYGPDEAKQINRLSLLSIVITIVVLQFFVLLPAAPQWPHQLEYKAVFDSVPRIVAGGLVAFYVAQRLNIAAFSALKRVAPWAPFALRKLACDILLHVLDTCVFVLLAFWGSTFSLRELLWGQLAMKFALTAVYVPLAHLLLTVLRRQRRDQSRSA